MALYQLTDGDRSIIQHMPDGTTRFIPRSLDNGDYLDFLKWDAIEGNDPDPADPPPQPTAQWIADDATLRQLKTVYQTLKAGTDAIQASKAALAQDATTLSGITVTSLAQVQSVLRTLGQDLGVMIDNTDKLARGSERVLDTLAALIRQQRPDTEADGVGRP